MTELAGEGSATPAADTETPAFAVRLDNFEGPFDLLLSLIAKHKLDITEVALSKVTDEFIAHIKMGSKGVEGRGYNRPERGGRSSSGQSARLWSWRLGVRVPSVTPSGC